MGFKIVMAQLNFLRGTKFEFIVQQPFAKLNDITQLDIVLGAQN